MKTNFDPRTLSDRELFLALTRLANAMSLRPVFYPAATALDAAALAAGACGELSAEAPRAEEPRAGFETASPAETAEAVRRASNALGAEFLLAGRAVFTVSIPPEHAAARGCAERYTFRIKKREAEGRYQTAYFAAVLTGPENTSDYSYLGIVEPNGSLRLTAKSQMNNDSAPVRLLRFVLPSLLSGAALPEGYAVHHEGKCGRCGRALTTPESIERGIGPECFKLGGGKKRAEEARDRAIEAEQAALSEFETDRDPDEEEARA